MDENMSRNQSHRPTKLSPEVYVYATSKHFLNVYDALRIDKFKVEIAGYDPTTNRQTGCASAWLDKDDLRLLAHLVCTRLFVPITGGRWERYGGSQKDDGSIESRTLTVEWDEGEAGRFAHFPYRLTITNGPGRRTSTGGVTPAGEPTARLAMRLPEGDMMKIMLAVGDYLHAYEAAHHHRIVAQRVRELRDKLEERASRYENEYEPHAVEPARPQPAHEPVAPMRAQTQARPADRAITAGALPVAPAQDGTAPTRPPLRAVPGGNRSRDRERTPNARPAAG